MNHNVANKICSYLSDKERIRFISINKSFNLFKKFISYETTITSKNSNITYFDNFVNFKITNYNTQIPKNVKRLYVESDVDLDSIDFNSYKIDTLTFNTKYNFTKNITLDATCIKNITIHNMDWLFLDFLKLCINLEQITIISCLIIITEDIFKHNQKLNKIITSRLEYLMHVYHRLTPKITIGVIINMTNNPTKSKIIKFYSGHEVSYKYIFDRFLNKNMDNETLLSQYDKFNFVILDYGINRTKNYDLDHYNLILFTFDDVIANKKYLHEVTFSYMFNKPITNMFDRCDSLKKITFGHIFNQSINNIFDYCPQLSEVNFGHQFNQSVNNIFDFCPQMTTVRFGNDFNQPVDNIFNFCPQMTTVRFGDKFNQSIDNIFKFCPKIILVQFGCDFNQSIKYTFKSCPELQVVEFGYYFNRCITNAFDNCPKLKLVRTSKKCFVGKFLRDTKVTVEYF